ncbi:type IV pilus biogenesis/stability protein PilW [Vibrio sp. TH_r3]|uniref:type IV pilus biogenesis/stability protein PilW n=1 Tax=Vibrio sp. TH_r3 TaxID=3082084 RepID=UPI0029529E4C|nr:type IV pilus biogenesis/stability protein PilW [Vibrio sp. TH_r3]MDV7105297.1 type IV pilus biogenesis/stability protein PilW [Vibrio sp. TH_r3]
MINWIVVTFLACIVMGCVTVSEHDSLSTFDNIKAADARIALGLNYLQANNRLKARENLELAIKFAPNYYRSLNSIAYYYQLVGENELADKAYNHAMWESPNNGELLNNYGAFLCRLGQYVQADKFFNRAIEQPLNYQIVDSLENAAICSLKSGNKTDAEFYFKRCLDYDPARYFSLIQLSKLLVEREEYDEARVRLVEFHEKFGFQSSSLHLLIKIENKVGNKEQAQQYALALELSYPNSTKLD